MTPQSLSRQSLPLAIKRDGSGLSGVYADMHTAPSPSSGCRQSHSRAGPSTSVVATEVSHCVFACLPSRFRCQVFPFLDTFQTNGNGLYISGRLHWFDRRNCGLPLTNMKLKNLCQVFESLRICVLAKRYTTDNTAPPNSPPSITINFLGSTGFGDT
jgi:hypothetical protein